MFDNDILKVILKRKKNYLNDKIELHLKCRIPNAKNFISLTPKINSTQLLNWKVFFFWITKAKFFYPTHICIQTHQSTTQFNCGQRYSQISRDYDKMIIMEKKIIDT